MKQLLNGVAIAAALAIAAPAWAQPAPPTPPPTPPTGAAKATAPVQMHRSKRVGTTKAAAPSTMADQLNAQELARVQGGGAPPPMPSSGVPGQPSPTMGIPKGTTPSPSTGR